MATTTASVWSIASIAVTWVAVYNAENVGGFVSESSWELEIFAGSWEWSDVVPKSTPSESTIAQFFWATSQRFSLSPLTTNRARPCFKYIRAPWVWIRFCCRTPTSMPSPLRPGCVVCSSGFQIGVEWRRMQPSFSGHDKHRAVRRMPGAIYYLRRLIPTGQVVEHRAWPADRLFRKRPGWEAGEQHSARSARKPMCSAAVVSS